MQLTFTQQYNRHTRAAYGSALMQGLDCLIHIGCTDAAYALCLHLYLPSQVSGPSFITCCWTSFRIQLYLPAPHAAASCPCVSLPMCLPPFINHTYSRFWCSPHGHTQCGARPYSCTRRATAKHSASMNMTAPPIMSVNSVVLTALLALSMVLEGTGVTTSKKRRVCSWVRSA